VASTPLEPAVPAPVGEPSREAPEGRGSGRGHTYHQILRSSALIGGSTAFTVGMGLLRSKAMALLLGPAGFGLMGLYGSIVQLAQSIAGMGVNASGVREIAAAVGTGDTARIARTAAILRRTSLALGVLGALALAALAVPVAGFTFGDRDRAVPVAMLSLVVLFGVVSGGQGALLQGLRRIPDLARVSVLGGVVGTVATVILVYAFREGGLVPSLVATGGATLAFSWWYSRRTGIEAPAVSLREVGRESGALLKLGIAFMASGLVMTGAAYLVRILIVRQVSLEAAGLYGSAWAIGGIYVGFILDAMGTDFYPRLTAAIKDREECNRIVNEQAHVSLLLAGPGVIATLVLAPLVLTLLYSAAFRDAVPLLRWLCLGAALKVVTWPMGFIVVADGRRTIFFLVEFAYALAYLALAWFLVGQVGLDGAGMAFFGSYLFHGVLLYPIVARLTGFRWSAANLRDGLFFLGAIAVVFGAFQLLPAWIATAVGVAVLTLSTVHSTRALVHLVSPDRLPGPFRKLLGLAALVRPRR